MFLRALLRKSQRVRFVTINGQRFKRVLARDAYVASAIARSLELFAETDCFPSLVTQYENEVWVEYVEGTRPAPSAAFAAQLAEFYAVLYQRDPQLIPIEDTPFVGRLQRDLRFLNQVGFIGSDRYGQLSSVAARLAPREAWVGFDYMDPVLKNFVIKPEQDGVCAIDVESVFDGNLIGSGIAKARVHWLTPPLLHIVREHLAKQDTVPNFFDYFPFIELQFLAQWTKTKFLTAKRKYLDATRFDRFLQL
jgi:hypothetical protein